MARGPTPERVIQALIDASKDRGEANISLFILAAQAAARRPLLSESSFQNRSSIRPFWVACHATWLRARTPSINLA
jgi:hypothetical protein